MYLAIRSDKPEAEIYLLGQQGETKASKVWLAARELARDLPGEVDALLGGDFAQLTGVIAYQGTGSFTGLRIGITVANAVAYAQHLSIVGTSGDSWLTDGVRLLNDDKGEQIVLPNYGAAPHITPARK